jgi:hypothetical protein
MKKLITASLLGLSMLGITASVEAAIAKQNRVLVIVSELDTRGARELAPLYGALEQLTQLSVHGILGSAYDRIEVLANRDATFANYKNKLKELARDTRVLAIDVIMSLHGRPGELAFDDQTWNTSTMETRFLMAPTNADQIAVTNMKRKLRMLYNLSCFGSSHRQNFINMGFDVVNGSINVNANSEVEFVPALIAWRNGIGFRDSFTASNNDPALFAADEPIRVMGRLQNNSLKNTNSKKLFSGGVAMKINSNAL